MKYLPRYGDRMEIHWTLRRIHKFHTGLEDLLEACICDAVVMWMGESMPGGGHKLEYIVRWWNPAAWVAWSRTVIFRDNSGSAFYRRQACQ